MGDQHETVHSRLWRDGALVEEDFAFELISDYLEEDGALVWVDICDPDPGRLNSLAEELTLDPHAVEDALQRKERAKATRYPTHTFITTYATRLRPPPDPNVDPEAQQGFAVSRISAFVLRRGIVTVRQGPGFDMSEVVRRWDENADLLKYGVGTLLHGFLDVIIDGHFEAVQTLDDRIEALEDQLFQETGLDRTVQRHTYQVRKDLVALRRVVLPMREVINSVLRNRQDLNAPRELDPYYDDLYDHVLRASEWTESLRDMISTIFETNLSLQDARLNTVMKKLTSWAAIIAVPTAVTGYFGQNVPFPGFARDWGYVLSCVMIVTVAGLLYFGFKRRGWL
jgi:magnesium transporter